MYGIKVMTLRPVVPGRTPPSVGRDASRPVLRFRDAAGGKHGHAIARPDAGQFAERDPHRHRVDDRTRGNGGIQPRGNACGHRRVSDGQLSVAAGSRASPEVVQQRPHPVARREPLHPGAGGADTAGHLDARDQWQRERPRTEQRVCESRTRIRRQSGSHPARDRIRDRLHNG